MNFHLSDFDRYIFQLPVSFLCPILCVAICVASLWIKASTLDMMNVLANMPPFTSFDINQLRRSAYAIVRLHHPNYYEYVLEEDFLSSESEDIYAFDDPD